MVKNQFFTRAYDPTRKYVSFDYEGLKSLTDESRNVIGNRMIDESHINLFTKYSEQKLRNMPAITVNERTGRLIDGQHRVRAIIKMIEQGKLPKNYRYDVMLIDISEEEERSEIINANINSKGWSQMNYIKFYMEDVCDDISNSYTMLDEWCRRHKLTAPKSEHISPKFRYGAAIIKGMGCSSILKNGLFNVTQEELDEADKIHNEICDIIEAMDRVRIGHWIEYMAISWFNARRNTDFKKFMKTLKNESILGSVKGRPSNTRRDWDYIFAYVKSQIR